MSEVTLSEINALSDKYLTKYSEYEDAKSQASKLYSEATTLENELLDLLEKSGQSKVYLEGKGTVYQIHRLSIKLEDKVKLFEYIEKTYGPEVLLGMQTINSQKLNSFFKEEVAKGVTELPGASQPVSMVSLGFKKG